MQQYGPLPTSFQLPAQAEANLAFTLRPACVCPLGVAPAFLQNSLCRSDLVGLWAAGLRSSQSHASLCFVMDGMAEALGGGVGASRTAGGETSNTDCGNVGISGSAGCEGGCGMGGRCLAEICRRAGAESFPTTIPPATVAKLHHNHVFIRTPVPCTLRIACIFMSLARLEKQTLEAAYRLSVPAKRLRQASQTSLHGVERIYSTQQPS